MTSDGVQTDVSADQFAALFGALRRWGRWGDDDEQGALHLITPKRVAAAARLVQDGVSVTMSLPLNTHAAPHCPTPADHHMTAVGGDDAGPGGVHFLKDYVGLDYHNDGHTHIDALSHVGFEGSLYNGRVESDLGDEGVGANSTE